MAKMYFIAVVAPKEINDEVLNWKTLMKDQFNCTVALRSPAHLTLIPPFWMEEGLENILQDFLAKFSTRQKPFQIALNGFSAFKPRVIFVDVLSSPALQKLQAALFQSLVSTASFPIEAEDRPFHPHVTVATRDLHKRTFREAWEIFKDMSYEKPWLVNSLSLLRHNQKNWDVIFTSQFGV